MNNNEFNRVLKEENYLFEKNYNELTKICDNINEIIKVEDNPGEFIMMQTFIPKMIDAKVFVFENIKTKIDILYKYDKPQEVLNVRDYIIDLICLSKDLRKAINKYDKSLIIKYTKLLIDKLNCYL